MVSPSGTYTDWTWATGGQTEMTWDWKCLHDPNPTGSSSDVGYYWSHQWKIEVVSNLTCRLATTGSYGSPQNGQYSVGNGLSAAFPYDNFYDDGGNDGHGGGGSPDGAPVAGNITLTGSKTIDGVATNDGDVVLVRCQTNKTENGPYVVNHAGAWSRHSSFNTSGEFFVGATFAITAGTVFAGRNVAMDGRQGSFTLGSTDIWFKYADGGGYMGLQTGANRPDGAGGNVLNRRQVLVAKWQGTSVTGADADYTGYYKTEGHGTHAYMDIDWIEGRKYRFKMEKSSNIWTFTLTDTVTMDEYEVAQITVNSAWGGLANDTDVSWTENFNTLGASECSDFQLARCLWYYPTRSGAAITSHNNHFGDADCEDASGITDVTGV